MRAFDALKFFKKKIVNLRNSSAFTHLMNLKRIIHLPLLHLFLHHYRFDNTYTYRTS